MPANQPGGLRADLCGDRRFRRGEKSPAAREHGARSWLGRGHAGQAKPPRRRSKDGRRARLGRGARRCRRRRHAPAARRAGRIRPIPVTDAVLRDPWPEDWSGLAAVAGNARLQPARADLRHRSNVGRLWPRLVQLSLGSGTSTIAPLVHDGVMYLVDSNSTVQAIDARSGDLIWSFARPLRRKRRGCR